MLGVKKQSESKVNFLGKFRNTESKTTAFSALSIFKLFGEFGYFTAATVVQVLVSQLGRDGSLLAGPSPSSLLPSHYSQCPKSELVKGQNDVSQILPLIQCNHSNAFPLCSVKTRLCVCVLGCSVGSDSCNPTDCSMPGSSVHGILQARIPEWAAISYSKNKSIL